MDIYVIRHGQTSGNVEKRFAGWTEYDLTDKGKADLEAMDKFTVDMAFCSPMRRCKQTCEIMVLSNGGVEIVEGLKECNFGDFEDKTHEELADNKAYLDWINGKMQDQIPGGDSLREFGKRGMTAFLYAVEKAKEMDAKSIAIVTHGGVIMGLMSGLFKGAFYSYTPENGGGYLISQTVDEKGKNVFVNERKL